MRILLWMASVALGCVNSGTEGRVDAGDLTVTLSADRATVGVGQELRITVTVTNTSSSIRALEFSTGCSTTFEFVDSSGRITVPLSVCPQVITHKTLAVGASFTDAHAWSRGALEPGQPAAGNYQLRGVLLATGDTVRSTPIAIGLP